MSDDEEAILGMISSFVTDAQMDAAALKEYYQLRVEF